MESIKSYQTGFFLECLSENRLLNKIDILMNRYDLCVQLLKNSYIRLFRKNSFFNTDSSLNNLGWNIVLEFGSESLIYHHAKITIRHIQCNDKDWRAPAQFVLRQARIKKGAQNSKIERKCTGNIWARANRKYLIPSKNLRSYLRTKL